MGLSAAQAAEAVGMTRQGIIKAIKTGKISAAKNDNGEWRVEPSELFRAYPENTPVAVDAGAKVEAGIQARLQAAEQKIEHLQALLARADQRADRAEIDADEWRKQAQTLALTDQRVKEARRGFWALFGK